MNGRIRPISLFFVALAIAVSQANGLRSLSEDEVSPEIFPFPSSESAQTIINGENAGATEFPWYTVYDGSILCGGALVAPDIVVTAAHCVDGGAPDQVRVGATTSSNGNAVQVCDSISHPNFRAQELENDVAVLVLCDTMTTTPALINTDSAAPSDGDSLIAMGFGRTNPNSGGGSATLQKLDMDYVTDVQCTAEYAQHNPDFNLCADNPDGGICFGDSGSPIVDASGMVYGVASFIIQACDSKFPDFYTRMSSYSTWVQNQICDQSADPPDNCGTLGDDDGPDNGGGGDGNCIIVDLFTVFLSFITDLLGGLGG